MIVMAWLLMANATELFAWNKNAPSSNVLIFVSFSMPTASLRGWLKEADKISAPVVIRGLLHNSFRDTTKAVMDIVSDNRGGVQLDPTLFKRFHIEKVPAVVVIDSACLAKEDCNNFNVAYGDVTLDYALREISRQNDSLSLYAESALKQLKESRK
jgi:type-F conjugative transfer system pilin assembly protein TrbC